MNRVTSELIKKIAEMKKVRDYIHLIVDYKKEEEYEKLFEEVYDAIKKINNDFSPNEIKQLIDIVDMETNEYIIYDKDEIIELMFPPQTRANRIIQSAYNWIESTQKINWLVNNVFCDNKYYDSIFNLNDNFIVATEKL